MNGMATRGPINDRHVSHVYWFKIFETDRTQPRDLRAGEETWQGIPTGTRPYEAYYINGFECI
jgi:hypothetical protein